MLGPLFPIAIVMQFAQTAFWGALLLPPTLLILPQIRNLAPLHLMIAGWTVLITHSHFQPSVFCMMKPPMPQRLLQSLIYLMEDLKRMPPFHKMSRCLTILKTTIV